MFFFPQYRPVLTYSYLFIGVTFIITIIYNFFYKDTILPDNSLHCNPNHSTCTDIHTSQHT